MVSEIKDNFFLLVYALVLFHANQLYDHAYNGTYQSHYCFLRPRVIRGNVNHSPNAKSFRLVIRSLAPAFVSSILGALALFTWISFVLHFHDKFLYAYEFICKYATITLYYLILIKTTLKRVI